MRDSGRSGPGSGEERRVGRPRADLMLGGDAPHYRHRLSRSEKLSGGGGSDTDHGMSPGDVDNDSDSREQQQQWRVALEVAQRLQHRRMQEALLSRLSALPEKNSV